MLITLHVQVCSTCVEERKRHSWKPADYALMSSTVRYASSGLKCAIFNLSNIITLQNDTVYLNR